MREFLSYLKGKVVFLCAITIATAIGGAASTLVLAAIPNSNGQINACYKNNTLTLRVTDPAGTCVANEIALSWKQNGMSNQLVGNLVGDDF